jgi:putative endonuclease
MALHNELGKKGEQLAEEYLTDLGYTILVRNWRHGRYEIDLITAKDGVLHFIEVKTRSNNVFGQPEEAIDRKKLRHMLHAGAQYHQYYPQWKRVQFDVLSISCIGNEIQYFLIEDVYL